MKRGHLVLRRPTRNEGFAWGRYVLPAGNAGLALQASSRERLIYRLLSRAWDGRVILGSVEFGPDAPRVAIASVLRDARKRHREALAACNLALAVTLPI